MTMPMQQGPPRQFPPQMPPQGGGGQDIGAMLAQLGQGQQGGPQGQNPMALQGLTAEGANAQQLNPATEAIQNLIARLMAQGAGQQLQGQPPGQPPMQQGGGF